MRDNHIWQRIRWNEGAEESLGALIENDRENVLKMIAENDAQLFHVTGPEYGGYFLIRFLGEPPEMECECLAFNGHNTAAGIGKLAELVKNTGANCLICFTEQEAVARLYKRQGWKITGFNLRFEL